MAECILLGNGGGGLGSDDVTATRAHVLAPYTAITSDSNDEPVAGTIPSQDAATHYATTSEQKIMNAGTYASGDQKLAKLTASGLEAANILRGKTISINNGKQNVFSVSGNASVLKCVSGSTTLENKTVSIGGVSFRYRDINPGLTPVFAFCLTDQVYVWRGSPKAINYCSTRNGQSYVADVGSNAPMTRNSIRLLGNYNRSSDNYIYYWIFGY